MQKKVGYHIAEIPRGYYGYFSKITEEYLEAKDAYDQDNSIMLLQELSDLCGAIEAFSLQKYNISLDQLLKMKDATKRAFEAGER